MRNISLFIIYIILSTGTTIAQEVVDGEKPIYFSFHNVNTDMFLTLFQDQVDFYDLFYKKTSEKYPEKIYDKYYLLQLYLRAGLPEKARHVLEDIVAKFPNLTRSTASNLYDEVLKFAYPKLSLIIIDSYGHIIVGKREKCYYSGMENYRCYDCLSFFSNLHDKEGWSISKIEDWVETNPKIREIDKLYLKVLLFVKFESKKKMQKITEELVQKINLESGDIDKLIEYLQVICIVRPKRLKNYNIDLSWIEREVHPAYSTDALRLSKSLENLGYSSQLEYFYRQALSIELQAKDYEYLNSFRSRRLPKEILRVSYLISLKESLSKLLLVKGKKEEAHALMVESIELSKQSYIQPNMVFAGQTQRSADIYKVEKELLDNEEIMVDSITYWYERFGYYFGREDMEKSEFALLKGINLLTSKYKRDTLHQIRDYRDFFRNYCWVLIKTNRRQQAFDLLLQELHNSIELRWANDVVGQIEKYFKETEINPWESIFWEYLSRNDYWHEDFIRLLIKACNDDGKERMYSKLDSLARSSPTRSYCLAKTFEHDYPDRSISYYEFACLNYPNEAYSGEQTRKECAKKLVELHLHFEDYHKAEAVMLRMELKYAEREVIANLRNMALIAAKKGDYSESIRLWSRIQNINPSDKEYLSEMCDVGMSSHLIDYYKGISSKIEKSVNSKRAIKEIRRLRKARKHNNG